MQRRFTCFPPPRFDLKRLMKLFYPRTGLGPTHYPLFSHEMGNWASPHFSRFPSLWFFCHWCKPQWIIRGTFDRWSVMFAKLPCFPFVKKKQSSPQLQSRVVLYIKIITMQLCRKQLYCVDIEHIFLLFVSFFLYLLFNNLWKMTNLK